MRFGGGEMLLPGKGCRDLLLRSPHQKQKACIHIPPAKYHTADLTKFQSMLWSRGACILPDWYQEGPWLKHRSRLLHSTAYPVRASLRASHLWRMKSCHRLCSNSWACLPFWCPVLRSQQMSRSVTEVCLHDVQYYDYAEKSSPIIENTLSSGEAQCMIYWPSA